jgi:hypothetical protein
MHWFERCLKLSRSIAERILNVDENILAVSIMDSNFNILETASINYFNQRFPISNELKIKSGNFCAAIYSAVQPWSTAFGKVRLIITDFDDVKTILIPMGKMYYVGAVLRSSANADYLASKMMADFRDMNQGQTESCA